MRLFYGSLSFMTLFLWRLFHSYTAHGQFDFISITNDFCLSSAAVVGMLVSFPSVAITAFKSKLVEPHEYGESIVRQHSALSSHWFF